ncbi:MAG: acyl-CoA dehydratase activase-related protein [Cellulosilyticaceae bacterium]
MMSMLRVGLDIGSTTVKLVVLDDYDTIIYKIYQRHYSDIDYTVWEILKKVRPTLKNNTLALQITGSGGLGIAEVLGVPFIQEVIAASIAIKRYIPETDVAIELGGEDAKITYFGEGIEQRMNGTCAGGTGAFIDQMASLLQTDASGLDTLAEDYKHIYPIASRCGVFAKTDVQSLLNEGMGKEDIAASIFQAVVNQTIGGLAQGKGIRGRVALMGGPLYFLPQLRKRFCETLNLTKEEQIIPEDGQFFVALGAALKADRKKSISCNYLYENWLASMAKLREKTTSEDQPLFENDEALIKFKERHAKAQVKVGDLNTYEGPIYVGIDAGSTTTKLAAINGEGELLYSFYSSNKGDPIGTTKQAIIDLYNKLNQKQYIANCAITGYGEYLLKEAFKIDFGEVETVAHYKSANFFLPGVETVLDIGGQDMKYIRIKEGAIHSVVLNEACSSGCGSFIETFAKSLSIDVHEFAEEALLAKSPVDLGSRCTVFMNSKVKQVQKEGASIKDISAGIATSVIKNALFKVIRLTNKEELGKKIVVQGGTFYNNAVLRALEKLLDTEVIRPDIAGIMGAFGCAILAKERSDINSRSTLLEVNEIENFSDVITHTHCRNCSNKCSLTVHHFNDGETFIMGNRCERGSGNSDQKAKRLPNMYDYKFKRVFRYKPLAIELAPRGTIGIPKALNQYEDYPFWFTFFTTLGYRVLLSKGGSKESLQKGMESIPSESVCYPAKLVHQEIADLLDRKIYKIFYPAIPYNVKEDKKAGNKYNCPVVTSYPETIFANVEELRDKKITFYKPFISFAAPLKVKEMLYETLKKEGLTYREVEQAVDIAYDEWNHYKEEIRQEGERILNYLEEENKEAIVLCGRPYHIEPKIHHGIPELINQLGYAVLCEDSIAHLGMNDEPLRVVDQWVYHSRMYRAAHVVTQKERLELVQLNSFGCGLDAVTTDQVQEILEEHHKLYTLLKIDEISNLGAAKIRLRSLVAARHDLRTENAHRLQPAVKRIRTSFTKAMKQTHTILAPQMAPIHFEFVEGIMRKAGYNIVVLEDTSKEVIETGLKYVNNDACYPAIITVGQMMHAVLSGKYDLNNTSLMITQTGGGCRATNYIAFLRRALKNVGLEHIPVISVNMSGLESNPGFKVTPLMLKQAAMGLITGDVIMKMIYKTRPYEKEKGAVNALYKEYKEKCIEVINKGNMIRYRKVMKEMIEAFDHIPLNEKLDKPKVGVVGEILVKFHPVANNNIVDFLEEEGAEVVVPDLIDFFLYCAYNQKFRHEVLGEPKKSWVLAKVLIDTIEYFRKDINQYLKQSKRFEAFDKIQEMAELASHHLSLGNQTGEGWLLTAEMAWLLEHDVNNIACLQPFACLPNHITGKGMIKEVKRGYPKANVVPIDYDPGTSEVNQRNRLKLMLSIAKEEFKVEELTSKFS